MSYPHSEHVYSYFQAPTGRSAIKSIDRSSRMTKKEEKSDTAVGLAELDGGKGIPLADVVREIRNGLPSC